ncbi:MAG: hypothetical protein IJU02_05740 [Lachnospiraceae bacterium]|nr:hypothetical protein [Lachnospiraceae bacterium]
MKRIIRRIVPILVMAMILALPMVSFAANGRVTDLESKSQNGIVTINGKSSEALSVAIFVYDESGQNLLDVGSAVVNDDKTFTRTITLPDGKYLVKVADYEGGDFAQTITTTSASSSNGTDPVAVKSSKTDDMNNPYLWIGIIGGTLLVGSGVIVYRITRV